MKLHTTIRSLGFGCFGLLVQIINSKRCALFFALGQQSNRGVESCQKWNY